MNLSVGHSVLMLVIITAILRGIVLWAAFDQLADDPDAYVAIAQTLATTGTFGVMPDGAHTQPTAFRPPLYPAILALTHRSMIATGVESRDPLDGGKASISRLAIAILHWAMALATVVATYFVALRMIGSHVKPGETAGSMVNCRVNLVATLAAFLVAVDPILVQSSVRVMTETLAALLAIVAVHCWIRLVERLLSPASVGQGDNNKDDGPTRQSVAWDAVPLASVLGLAYLCRPTFIVWTALLIGYLMLWGGRNWLMGQRRKSDRDEGGISPLANDRACNRSKLDPVIAAATLVVVTGLFVCGWSLRNQVHFGKPIWATTHGGYTLLLGNNPPFFQYMRSGGMGIAWDPQPFFDRWEMRNLADPRAIEFWDSTVPPIADPDWQAESMAASGRSELKEDRLAYETAKMAISNDRSGFAWATLWRIGRLLSPMPQVFSDAGIAKRWGAAVVTIYYCAVIVLLIRAMSQLSCKLLGPNWVATLTLVLSLVAVHAIYWSNMRMRAPATAPLAILAAVSLCRRNELQ